MWAGRCASDDRSTTNRTATDTPTPATTTRTDRVAGVTLVTGPAAEFIDQQAAIGSRLALALTLLIGLPLLVLWLMTGSVVLPVRR